MSMFDDLRNADNKNSSPFFEDDQPAFEEEQPKAASRGGTKKSKGGRKGGGTFQFMDSKGRILGMTAPQRFILSAMLLMVVCVMGSMFMLVIGAFYLPF